MGKTLVYLVILALLGFGVYYFLFNDNSDSPFSKSEAGFTIRDTAGIGKIFLVATDGESITLSRTDTGWVVNNKYKALPSTLNLLLYTLYKQAALSPVTKNAYDNVVKNLSTNGVKVEVYGKDGKKLRIFYVGGAAVNNIGTNMMMEGAHMPYVVQVEGFNGYLTPRFTTKLRDWRDRTVFNIAPEEIKSVSLQYADKPINSFVITRDNSSFSVEGDKEITGDKAALNTRRVNVYLKYFKNVNCEGFINGLEDVDSAIRTAPKQSTIDIEGVHGQHLHADIYWMAINKRSKNLSTSNVDVPDEYDADRLYAIINNKQDTVVIQQMIFKNIFRKAFEFYARDNAPAQNPQAKRDQVMDLQTNKYYNNK